MKNILLVKNLKDEASKSKIKAALEETRVEFEVNIDKECVIVEGNYDMVVIAKRIINDLGFTIL